MLKKIVKGYGELLNSILKIFILTVLCAACGMAVVLPLWKFATALPHAYTITVILLFSAAAVFLTIKKAVKAGLRSTLIFAARIFVIAAGLTIIFFLVIGGLKVLSLPVLVLMIFLYGLLSFSVKSHQKKELQNESDL